MAGKMSADPQPAMKHAAIVAGSGLLLQFGASLYWTPLTFIVSTAVGLPLVLGGALMFLRAVLRIMKHKGVF